MKIEVGTEVEVIRGELPPQFGTVTNVIGTCVIVFVPGNEIWDRYEYAFLPCYQDGERKTNYDRSYRLRIVG